MKIKSLLKKQWFANALALCIAILFYILISNIGMLWKGVQTVVSHLQPVIFALVIAYVMGPLVRFFETHVLVFVSGERPRRTLAVFWSFIAVILVITILLVALIPQIIESIVNFGNNLPTYISTSEASFEELRNWADKNKVGFISTVFTSISASVRSIAAKLPETITNIVEHSVNFGKSAFSMVISSILAIYFLCDAKKLKKGFKRLMHAILPGVVYRYSADFWHRCDSILIKYIVCDILDGLIVGIVNWLFMTIAGMQYAMIISVLVGITNLAPTFGPIVGAVIGAFILVLINPWHALWFIVATIVIQTIDGYIIKPKLFGDTLGVSGLWILVGIVVGGRMFGVVGILLAIPVIAIVDYFYHNYLIGWLENRRQRVEDIKEKAAKKGDKAKEPENSLKNE